MNDIQRVSKIVITQVTFMWLILATIDDIRNTIHELLK